jgi:dGTPase
MNLYDSEDLERWVSEPNKSVERSEFARDRARVMHSAALRRLAAKTQVMEAGRDDFPRTRLTHSLECAQVGRELGAALGCDPDLVDTACLAHDLGHPPFGHNGEGELNRLAQDFGGFEGNAQTFRLLTRLEPKAISPVDGPRPGQSIGLNLTRASLDAASKYPWVREPNRTKFGVYQDDVDVFQWVRGSREDESTSFEAQVMDWADDVSYCVHDIEDAIHAGHLEVGILTSPAGRADVIAIAQAWYGAKFAAEELEAALIRLRDLAVWPRAFTGTTADLAGLKNLTSTLIGRFCVAASQATTSRYGTTALNRYRADLVVPDTARYEVTALKALAALFVMNRDGADEVYARQRQEIRQLHEALVADPHSHLDVLHRDLYVQATTPEAEQRVIIDQIASLTDVSLIAWHRQLCN